MRTVILALLLATGLASPADAVLDGRSDRDLEMERFLRRAEVVGDEPVGAGITGSRRLTLAADGVECHAIFKVVDERGMGPVLDERSGRIDRDFSDSWRYEIVAYRLDRALGLGLVPVTVERRIGRDRGSLQEWVEDTGSFRDVVESGDQRIRGDEALLLRHLTEMYVLDALIANADRTFDNILLDPDGDRFFLVDHSRSFRNWRDVDPPTLPEPVPLEVGLRARLQALDREALDALAGDLLLSAQVRSLILRRDALVRVLTDAGLLPPA